MNPLWIRQVRGVLGLELRKTLFSGRAIPLYLLALVPVGLATMFVLVSLTIGGPDDMPNLNGATIIYAAFFQLILRLLLYLGCVWTFMNLFRGEVIDRSLHYYFLAPIRREVLVAGKFLSGLAGTIIFFGLSTIASSFIFFSYYGVGVAADHLLAGPGFGQLLAYISVVLLACLGYGAVFLLVGLFFRNPIIPAAIFWVWEWMNPVMPALPPPLRSVTEIDPPWASTMRFEIASPRPRPPASLAVAPRT